mgnify:CR=1 FL=1|tara:strand:- start:1832 stop:2209 length:378 start_codon:yes stop_codon:yes gene_type:complete
MKPKLTLTIIGIAQVLQGIAIFIFAESVVETFLNVGDEGMRVGVLMHYGLAPAFLMIGLMLLFARDFAIESQKKLLLALIIGYLPLFAVFYHFSSVDFLNFTIEGIIPDIVLFGLALFTYLKPKE